MNNHIDTRNIGRRTLVALLGASFAFGPLYQPAYAQTPLADVPIAAKVAAKPNIVYTVDDSGSMASNFIPDFVTSSNYPAFCRGAIQVNAANGKPFYNTSGGFNVTSQACGAGSITAFNFPAFYAADFNHLAYDPNVTYQPPTQADGTSLSSGVSTDSAGNQTSLKTVQTDPYNNPLSTVDLSVTVTVPLYCNTDWPIITNPVGDRRGRETLPASTCWVPAPTAGSTAPSTTRMPTARPAVADDYNYPWPKVGAAAGAAGSANAAAYFWRQNATRQIWCDKTSSELAADVQWRVEMHGWGHPHPSRPRSRRPAICKALRQSAPRRPRRILQPQHAIQIPPTTSAVVSVPSASNARPR